MTPQKLVLHWLKGRLSAADLAWLEEKSTLLATGAADKDVYTAYSSALRHSGKAPLELAPADLDSAQAASPGWDPSDWTCEQAARVALLLALPPGSKSSQLMDRVYQTADVGEAVALQKAIAVLGHPEGHMARARDGIRSNIQSVFEAVTVRNPYPAMHFDALGWNQMVTKTFFVGVPLHLVVGLDRRVNPDLARILNDLAHERWAADRPFSPELWRCVGPHADARALEDLKKVLNTGTPLEQRAAALALHASPRTEAARIIYTHPELAEAAQTGALTWERLYDGE